MKIAIIGSGISGLGAAYILNKNHEITVYEKNEYIGGHSRTVFVDVPDGPEGSNSSGGKVPVDTGFIVFNYKNYPLLTSLFKHLDVPIAESDMSFGVSINNGWLEYGTQTIENVLAQKANLIRLQYWLMIWDVTRFNKRAYAYLDRDENITLGQCLNELRMGQWFRDYFLLAMGGAIWSTPLEQMLDFPARSFIRFFANHGLLSTNGQPQWYTVKGGSREYIKRLTQSFANRIRLNTGVASVRRTTDQVIVKDCRGAEETYDHVIFACHSDQAASLLSNPTQQEQDIIGAIKYQPNKMVLHSDTNFMPKRKKAWSSWVYLSEQGKDKSTNVSLSYWMNNLQPLNTSHPIIVTLNPGREPDPEVTHDTYTFEHPVFSPEAIRAQNRIDEIQGKDRVWYCGAWQGYGFHEDGLMSAVKLCQKMGEQLPWK